MICFQIPAGFREKTLTIFADSFCQLLLAGWMAEISGRPAHIMDISFEIRFFGKSYSLLQYGFMASGLYDPSLMKSQGTEIAASKASPVAGNTEPYLFHGRNLSFLFIHRMIGSHIGKTVNLIHLLLAQWL